MRLFSTTFSLRTRLFLAMILLVLLACLMILGATYFQYQNEAEDYNLFRLDRKENQVRRHVNYLVQKNGLLNANDSIWALHQEELKAIAEIHKVEFSLFTLEGDPLFVSFLPLKIIANNYHLDERILRDIGNQTGDRFLEKNEDEIGKFQSSYSYLRTPGGTPYGILFFPYFEDVSFSENELNIFLQRLYQIYLIMMVVSILAAFFLARFVTRSLERIRRQMDQTGLLKRNEKINLKNATREIQSLVNSYNKMIDDLEDSAEQLAKSSKDQAWQEMARQVAHEIKNPLTPMRLTVQSFQRNYDPTKSNHRAYIQEFAQILIEQIDTMSQVANAFSDYATLPKAQLKMCDAVEVTKRATEIFEQEEVVFSTNVEKFEIPIDRTQWIRVLTNLIQNGLQSIPANKKPEIKVQLNVTPKFLKVRVSDNGMGIPKDLKDKIFEPKFTTKSKGMGLGLGIVKNIVEAHHGSIKYTSEPNQNTTFTIKIKRTENE